MSTLKPILETMWELPYREIAEELTNRNIPTPRGGDAWSQVTVMRDAATGHHRQMKKRADAQTATP
jgi:hypothetical protein